MAVKFGVKNGPPPLVFGKFGNRGKSPPVNATSWEGRTWNPRTSGRQLAGVLAAAAGPKQNPEQEPPPSNPNPKQQRYPQFD